jgi:hypothetical protein
MSVINSYYIIDGESLCGLVSVSDAGCLNVKYFQISIALPQYKIIAHSQYFVYIALSVNNLDWIEWLSERSGHFEYVQLAVSNSQIELILNNNA